jgi:hypothetical protein
MEAPMPDEERYTLAEAGAKFARRLHGEVWSLMEQADRTPAEAERMLYAAFASTYHWLDAGTGVNHQRGEWLIARVYAVLGDGPAAIEHAARCDALTREHADLLEDFDRAFNLEMLARAHAVSGERAKAEEYLEQARKAGAEIVDEEDRKIFFDQLAWGDWRESR